MSKVQEVHPTDVQRSQMIQLQVGAANRRKLELFPTTWRICCQLLASHRSPCKDLMFQVCCCCGWPVLTSTNKINVNKLGRSFGKRLAPCAPSGMLKAILETHLYGSLFDYNDASLPTMLSGMQNIRKYAAIGGQGRRIIGRRA